ncbi:hypothetical protein OAU25_02450 [Crocinitomicaceae bacterium]|nr:hypothetical protein [Crocinitomicaceae bacterium]
MNYVSDLWSVMNLNGMCQFLFILFLPLSFWSQDCDSIPELNRKIIALANQKVNTTVGRGECWDLADFVLEKTNAVWDHGYKFGELIDPDNTCIQPGDIMQFKNVRLQWKEGNMVYFEKMQHHTAIVLSRVSDDQFLLIHQNIGEHGRKVGVSPLLLSAIKTGTIMVYRPVAFSN